MQSRAFFKSLGHGRLSIEGMACSAIGGTTLGLYFLLLDVINGRPFFTPMLLGSVLFHGASPDSVVGLDVVTILAYTLIHFCAFAVIGLVASILAHLADYADDPHTLVAIGVLAIEIASFGMAIVVFPGVIEMIGYPRIIVANLFAVVAIVTYLTHFRPHRVWHPA